MKHKAIVLCDLYTVSEQNFLVGHFLLSEVTMSAGSVFLSFAPNNCLLLVLGEQVVSFIVCSVMGFPLVKIKICFQAAALLKMDNLPYFTNTCCFCVFCLLENYTRAQDYCHCHMDYTEIVNCLSVYYTSCGFFSSNYRF